MASKWRSATDRVIHFCRSSTGFGPADPLRGPMTNSGLTRRLRQQSHRSGLAVGITMAMAIAICLGAFTFLYVKLDPWVRDFSGSESAPTATPGDQASGNEENVDEEP